MIRSAQARARLSSAGTRCRRRITGITRAAWSGAASRCCCATRRWAISLRSSAKDTGRCRITRRRCRRWIAGASSHIFARCNTASMRRSRIYRKRNGVGPPRERALGSDFVTTPLPTVSQAEWDRVQRMAVIAALAGGAGFIVLGLLFSSLGALTSPVQFFLSYLVAYNFWLGIALGSLVILMLQYVTGGGWGFAVRRVLESGTRTLLLLAILFIPILLGLHFVYVWTEPEESVGHKARYLNVPFFIVRAVVYFAVWLVIAFLLNRWSARWDAEAQPGTARPFRLLSAPGLALYGATITFASIDWIMSLEPDWYSTIYPVMFAVGQVLTAFAFTITVVVLLATRLPLIDVISPGLLRDLGNLMLAFVMFWAYIAVSQFLLTW